MILPNGTNYMMQPTNMADMQLAVMKKMKGKPAHSKKKGMGKKPQGKVVPEFRYEKKSK